MESIGNVTDKSIYMQRLEQFRREYLKMGQTALENELGWGRAYLSKTKEPTATKLQSVINKYPELNKYWLFFGEGDMLVTRKSGTRAATHENHTTDTHGLSCAEIANKVKNELYDGNTNQMALETGIKRTTLISILNGETKNPQKDTWEKICAKWERTNNKQTKEPQHETYKQYEIQHKAAEPVIEYIRTNPAYSDFSITLNLRMAGGCPIINNTILVQ